MPLLRTRIVWTVIALAVLGTAAALYANHRFAQLDVRHRAVALTGGNPERGRTMFVLKGCGGCHTIDGVPGARGLVGPPLTNIAERAILAGVLENNPANLQHWISTPQSIVPGNDMPDIPMTAADTRDIAAFLYTQTG